MPAVTFRGSRAELRERLRTVVAAVTGRGPDPLGLAAAVLVPAGEAALEAIRREFLVKSRGGTGQDGIVWEPLQPATIAYSRMPKGPGKRGLTPAQDRRWAGVYARTLARARLTLGEGEARALAGRVAWADAKRAGAVPKVERAAGLRVAVGVRTGSLLASLSPGGPGGVLRLEPGAVAVGSAVPHFAGFHARRPCWPRDGTLPDDWRAEVTAAVGRGLIAAVERMAREGRA